MESEANDVQLWENNPIQQPKNNQICLKIESFIKEKPMLMDRATLGIVIKCGHNIKGLQIGDLVAVEPNIPCRTCILCKGGKYNLCPRIIVGPKVQDGSISTYFVHDYDFCYKLPSNMNCDEAVLIESLAVGVHACKRANVTSGDKVLILGAGSIGLFTLLAAKAFGASKIIITDMLAVKLNMAKKLGADYGYTIQQHVDEDSIVENLKELLGCEPNISFECTGAESCMRVALKVTRRTGIATFVKLGNSEVTIPLPGALRRQIDLKGAFRYGADDFRTAIEMVSSNKVDVRPIITHHLRIGEL